jgi:hypothetical protein
MNNTAAGASPVDCRVRPVRDVVNAFMEHQLSGTRPAMTALQDLVDAAYSASVQIEHLAAGLAAAEEARDALRARVLDLEAQCEAGAASEQRWIDWLVAQGLLHYYPHCKRPDGSNGPAWVLRSVHMTNGDSCEAWSADTAADALRGFLRA